MKSKRYILIDNGKYVKWISWIAHWIPNSFHYTDDLDEIMIVNDSYLDYELEVGENKKESRKSLLIERHPGLEIREVKVLL